MYVQTMMTVIQTTTTIITTPPTDTMIINVVSTQCHTRGLKNVSLDKMQYLVKQ